MMDFGKGPTLEHACQSLEDRAERTERILDVAERNSVIEGLPPLSDELRRQLREQLNAGVEPRPAPVE